MLKEEVQALYDREHSLTNESLRRYDNHLPVDDIEAEEIIVKTKLKTILDTSLRQGIFKIDSVIVDKKDATVNITNDVLVIPCRVSYKKFGLSEFARKPGKKQIEEREFELKKIPIETLKGLNQYVVGTSRFEAQEGSYVVFCRSIQIVA